MDLYYVLNLIVHKNYTCRDVMSKDNFYGQLGLGHDTDLCHPTKFIFCESIIIISCGRFHTGI